MNRTTGSATYQKPSSSILLKSEEIESINNIQQNLFSKITFLRRATKKCFFGQKLISSRRLEYKFFWKKVGIFRSYISAKTDKSVKVSALISEESNLAQKKFAASNKGILKIKLTHS